MDQLHAVAGQLLVNEKMDGEVFNSFMASGAIYFPGTEPVIEEKTSTEPESAEVPVSAENTAIAPEEPQTAPEVSEGTPQEE